MQNVNQQMETLKSEFASLKKETNKAIARLNKIDKHATEEHLDEIHESAQHIRKRFEIELHKNVVLIETGRFLALEHPSSFNKLFLRMLEVMDYPYEWWAETHEWTLGEWREYLLKIAEKNKKLEEK